MHASASNVPGALIYVHDDAPPGRFHSTALWSSRNSTSFMTETNSSGGYRVFAATEVSKEKIVFTSRGQLDDVVGGTGNALRQERFIYEVTSPDSYRMRFEVVRDGGAWSQVDFVDFKRCPPPT